MIHYVSWRRLSFVYESYSKHYGKQKDNNGNLTTGMAWMISSQTELRNSGEEFDVQRWYQTLSKSLQNEFNVIGDASKDAFCAVTYFGTEIIFQDQSVFFIMVTARVAPIKHPTISKLGVDDSYNRELFERLNFERTNDSFHKVYSCSQSKKVIQWIRLSNEKQPTFDSNRVVKKTHQQCVNLMKLPAVTGLKVQNGWRNHLFQIKKPASSWAGYEFSSLKSKRSSLYSQLGTIQPIQSAEANSCLDLNACQKELWKTITWRAYDLETCSKRDACKTNCGLKIHGNSFFKSKIGSMSPFIDTNSVLRATGRLRGANCHLVQNI